MPGCVFHVHIMCARCVCHHNGTGRSAVQVRVDDGSPVRRKTIVAAPAAVVKPAVTPPGNGDAAATAAVKVRWGDGWGHGLCVDVFRDSSCSPCCTTDAGLQCGQVARASTARCSYSTGGAYGPAKQSCRQGSCLRCVALVLFGCRATILCRPLPTPQTSPSVPTPASTNAAIAAAIASAAAIAPSMASPFVQAGSGGGAGRYTSVSLPPLLQITGSGCHALRLCCVHVHVFAHDRAWRVTLCARLAPVLTWTTLALPSPETVR